MSEFVGWAVIVLYAALVILFSGAIIFVVIDSKDKAEREFFAGRLRIEYPKLQKRESNLVSHARRELELIREEPETIEWYLRVVKEFASYGHSGGSMSVAVPTLQALLSFQNLSPLTKNPDEWMFISEDLLGGTNGIWQNVRNGEAFSNDGGVTYYLLSENKDPSKLRIMHKSAAYRSKERDVNLPR